MSRYARFIGHWERHLASRDTAKIPGHFTWGWEWLRRTPFDVLPPLAETTTAAEGITALAAWNGQVLDRSTEFYTAEPVREWELREGWLKFRSPVAGPYPENNMAWAQWFPAPISAGRRRAVLVLPQWNADAASHVALCRFLPRLGISALRLSLPYHDRRLPAGLRRAEYNVDNNIGRTIHAARQAVCDARACLDWLEQDGYASLAILGTSLGSCYAFLTTAHDARPRVNVFNHASAYFGDVVWTGLATQHVRAGFEGVLDGAALREAWRAISPASYYARMAEAKKRILIISGRHDPSFLPDFTRDVLRSFDDLGVGYAVRWLPCGHHTIGRFPFKYIDAALMITFLRRHL